MLQEKIKLNYKLTALIKKNREENGITAAKLSTDIGKTISYISSLEHNRIKFISQTDLIAIIKIVFKVGDNEATKKIEEWLSNKELNNDDVFDHIFNKQSSDQNSVSEYPQNLDSIIDQQLFSQMLNSVKHAFLDFYNHDSKKSLLVLTRIISSINSDIGFEMAYISAPMFMFDKVPFEEKQEVLNRINSILEPYIKKYIAENSKKDSQEEQISLFSGSKSK